MKKTMEILGTFILERENSYFKDWRHVGGIARGSVWLEGHEWREQLEVA